MLKKKQRNRIANRLASIANTTADLSDVRIPELKGGGRPERAKREQVFRPGKIYLTKADSLPCVIRNVSATGAFIRIEGAHPLPPVVVLRFDQTGVVKKARVAWQNENEAGLAFITPAAEAE